MAGAAIVAEIRTGGIDTGQAVTNYSGATDGTLVRNIKIRAAHSGAIFQDAASVPVQAAKIIQAWIT